MPRRLQGWAALPQGESSAARSRETGGTIGCAVLELPGGVRIRFRDQPAAFVAACAVEAGLRSSSSLASQERSTASQASSAPTAASRRRLRQDAAAAAAAPASSALQSSSVSSAPSEALSARTSIESEPSASCARADKTVGGGPMNVDGPREAAPAACCPREPRKVIAGGCIRHVFAIGGGSGCPFLCVSARRCGCPFLCDPPGSPMDSCKEEWCCGGCYDSREACWCGCLQSVRRLQRVRHGCGVWPSPPLS